MNILKWWTGSEKSKNAALPNNDSLSRFVNEGNPDSQIQTVQKESGEKPNKPIPDGDRP